MTMTLFLQSLGFNLLSQTVPLSVGIYLAIRMAIAHGGLSFRRKHSSE